MAQALDVARYFVFLAAQAEEEGDALCPMRLQKLLYYAQAWHLGATGAPLFAEAIEAWPYGPVVKALYPVFKGFGLAIPASEGADPQALSERQKAFVRSVWDRYKRFSAIGLSQMTHQEVPWIEADARRDPNDAFNSPEITVGALRAYFLPRYLELLRTQDARIDPVKWRAAADAVADGRVRTPKDIRSALRHRRAGADSN
jgi:uncharacterized phage-associated protein